MYEKVDEENPNVPFKESNYYKQKRHLRGLLSKEGLKGLKNQIKNMGDHCRDVYDLS